MRLEDIIMVMEKQGEDAAKRLIDFAAWFETLWEICGDNMAALGKNIRALYETKESSAWTCPLETENSHFMARFCRDEQQLREFLTGSGKEESYRLDTDRSTPECLDTVRARGLTLQGAPYYLNLHYEKIPHAFRQGQVLHNFNGLDYRVLKVLDKGKLLLMSIPPFGKKEGGQFLVALGAGAYRRYPLGEDFSDDSIGWGVEWDHGVYLGDDLTAINMEALEAEYGKKVSEEVPEEECEADEER